jgi:outer membrane receptor protein involved in Fe transport
MLATRIGRSPLSAIALFYLLSLHTVQAQDLAQPSALAEVTVTASREGEQNLQDVPMAVSVISPTEVQAFGLASITDIANEIPSLSVQSLSPGVNKFDMRGLVTTNLDITNTGDLPLVEVYLDDTPISMPGFTPDLKVFDLQRIEVLPGPQGTLYGAGSMAGTIRFITIKPNLTQLTGYVEAEGSATESGSGSNSERALINIPLVQDTAALRLSAYRAHDGGWIYNLASDQRDVNSSDTTQARAALRVRPNDDLTIDASYVHSRLTADGRNDIYSDLGYYVFDTRVPERSTDNLGIANLTLDWTAFSYNIMSSTSDTQRSLTNIDTFDYDALYDGLVPTRVSAYEENNNEVKDFTEEVRVVSPQEQRFRWTSGAFYEDLQRSYPENAVVPGMDSYLGIDSVTQYLTPIPNDIFYGLIGIKAQQLAFFGEGTYTIFSNTSLTAGLRYFSYRQHFSLLFAGLGGVLAPGEASIEDQEARANGINPRVVIKHTVSKELMVYGEASRGFRYGGANEPVPPQFCGAALAQDGLTGAPLTYGPDHLWNYSIGEKSTLLDGRLTADSDVFLINWDDVQTAHGLNCGYGFTENAGHLRSQGTELQTAYRISPQLTIGFSGSFTDAYARGDIPNIDAFGGDRAPFFPRWIANVNAAYVQPVGANAVTLRVDYTHRGDSYTNFNSQQFGYFELPPMNILNLSAAYTWGPAEVTVFVNNLSNTREVNDLQAAATGSPQPGNILFIGRPRTMGVRVHVDF